MLAKKALDKLRGNNANNASNYNDQDARDLLIPNNNSTNRGSSDNRNGNQKAVRAQLGFNTVSTKDTLQSSSTSSSLSFQQQRIHQDQDLILEDMSESIKRLSEISMGINKELDVQAG